MRSIRTPWESRGEGFENEGALEVWVKELAGNRRAVALLNRSDQPANIAFSWEEADVTGEHTVRNLWTQEDVGDFQEAYQGQGIAAHDALVLLLTPK